MWIVYLPTLLFRATQHILLLLTHIACACGGGGRTNILFLSLWTMQRSSSCTKLIYTLEQRFEKIKRVRQCKMTSADKGIFSLSWEMSLSSGSILLCGRRWNRMKWMTAHASWPQHSLPNHISNWKTYEHQVKILREKRRQLVQSGTGQYTRNLAVYHIPIRRYQQKLIQWWTSCFKSAPL